MDPVESVLTVLMDSIVETNKNFVQREPSIPVWTATFAVNLQRQINRYKKKERA
jgi:hypothetical protein